VKKHRNKDKKKMPWETRLRLLFIFGILIILVGALPFLQNLSMLKPFIGLLPSSGIFYNAGILILGVLCILFIGRKKEKWGPKYRLLPFIIGLLLFGLGALPLSGVKVPSFIPIEGTAYNIFVMAIGILAILLGRPRKEKTQIKK